MLYWLAEVQQTSDPTDGGLIQYGAVGLLATLGIGAAVYLYRRAERQHELQREEWQARLKSSEEREQASRDALLNLYDRMSGEFASKLTEATGSMQTFVEVMRDRGDR